MSLGAAQSQLSANEIIHDAFARRSHVKPLAKVEIIDLEELKDYQLRQRTEFESYLKRNRLDLGQWSRYALFEIEQHDMRRARSVFERALMVDASYVPLWIKYIDSELKLKYINHARNLLDRAVTTLPRVDKLWYKYLFVEESLENWDVVRSLYNKWISLEPNINAWDSFIEYEKRQNQTDNVRNIFSRYILLYPQAETWLKWIKFESVFGTVETVRKVYSLAVDTLISYIDQEPRQQQQQQQQQSPDFTSDASRIIISFANWEASKYEYERCQAIYDIALKKWPNDSKLKDSFLQFQKRFGDERITRQNILLRRKLHMENSLDSHGSHIDYYKWWIYIDLIEQYFPEEILTAFERAASSEHIPLNATYLNDEWEQYLYVWIRYLSYVELQLNDIDLCRTLYKRVIDEIIPHSKFTSTKLWIMFAEFEIRQENINRARTILGTSIGLCPHKILFDRYIEIEIKLKEFDRVRKLYEKYLEYDPNNLQNWFNYAELEENLGDEERSRGIYNIMLNSEVGLFPKPMQFKIFDRFITFETDMEEYNHARLLYEKYLIASDHSVSVFISYAMYQCSVPTDEQLLILQKSDDEEIEFQPDDSNFNNARSIYERAMKYYKEEGNNPESRLQILEALYEFEKQFGDESTIDKIAKRMPRKMKRVKEVEGIEQEYVEYIFPEDETQSAKPSGLKLLALAKKWKQDQNK